VGTDISWFGADFHVFTQPVARTARLLGSNQASGRIVTTGKIKLDGNSQKFEKFVALLDTFDPWYQVAMPIAAK
jgi:alkyl sulfatase BDS1-like metallo-beta-lactamase superfamily hydrolase